MHYLSCIVIYGILVLGSIFTDNYIIQIFLFQAIVHKETDRVVGMHMVGAEAGEIT